MNSGKLMLGILGGAAAGAALGVFFASDKGLEIRKTISKIGDDYLEEIPILFDLFLENIVTKYKSTKGDADALIDKSKTKINDRYSKFKNDDHHDSILPKNDLNL